MNLLVINCGSATLRFKYFEATDAGLEVLAAQTVAITGPYRSAVDRALASLPVRPDVIAHRVVHGGGRLPELARIDAGVLEILRELGPLAPMHNGPALEGVEATLGAGVPLIAALDSAFHQTLPPRAWRYALPDFPGVRRYEFHGWSHRYVTERYAELTGLPEPTIITLHLGSGCSAAAISQGRSVDTSMGYSPLEGGWSWGPGRAISIRGSSRTCCARGMRCGISSACSTTSRGSRRSPARRTCESCSAARTGRPSSR
jgi:acetate kinase